MLYIFVKPEVKINSSTKSDDQKMETSNPKISFIDELHPLLKRKLGIFFAILSGIFYGIMVKNLNKENF
jgi:hypothetical protein